MEKDVQAILNLLSEGAVVEGDIQTPRDIRIDGSLVGTVRTDGRLILGPSSRYRLDRYCRVKGKIKREGNDFHDNDAC